VQHAIHMTVVALILDAVAFVLMAVGLSLIYRRKFPTSSVPSILSAPRHAGAVGAKADGRPSWLGVTVYVTGGAIAVGALSVAHFGVANGHYPIVQMIVLVTSLAALWGGWWTAGASHNRGVRRSAPQAA
jgi:hypothetical protein